MANFDPVASRYRWLEYVAFGGALQRARVAHFAALADCHDILVIGDGDGRALAALTQAAPAARIHCIDTSRRMLDHAAGRLPADARTRVTFAQEDVRTFESVDRVWDAVVTLFVLDCFDTQDVRAIVGRLSRALGPQGRWLFADFAEPPHGWRRWRARLWIALLYRFFRWQTGLNVSQLPDCEGVFASAGWVPLETREFQAGMLRSVRYGRA